MNMNTPSRLIFCAALALAVPAVALGDDYDGFVRKSKEAYESFKAKSEKDYADFREKANKAYEDFMRKPWKPAEILPEIPAPPDPEPGPVTVPIDEPAPAPRPVVIDSIVPAPVVEPRPEPISPIEEVPVVSPVAPIQITFYGTPMTVRKANLGGLRIAGTAPDDIADAWGELCGMPLVNNLLRDCLDNRDRYSLSDWAYLLFLEKVAGEIVATPAEKALLIGFLLSQSGYKTRFAIDEAGMFHLMYAVTGCIYQKAGILSEGFYFYPLKEMAGDQVRICDYVFPGEKAIYMGTRQNQDFSYKPAETLRGFTVHGHPDVYLSVMTNQNLIDYYNDLPDCRPDRDPYSKWALYANAPASYELQACLYPVLREQIKGKTQAEAANFLIRVAQSFPYGLDDDIWGYDRAFFPDETWFYPKSDCEDHAIHFSRLVRDLLGLEVALVYYPGHLASAVAFTDGSATGDYIESNGKRWIVCDPTYFYADVGRTMPGEDNSSATLIYLER